MMSSASSERSHARFLGQMSLHRPELNGHVSTPNENPCAVGVATASTTLADRGFVDLPRNDDHRETFVEPPSRQRHVLGPGAPPGDGFAGHDPRRTMLGWQEPSSDPYAPQVRNGLSSPDGHAQGTDSSGAVFPGHFDALPREEQGYYRRISQLEAPETRQPVARAPPPRRGPQYHLPPSWDSESSRPLCQSSSHLTRDRYYVDPPPLPLASVRRFDYGSAFAPSDSAYHATYRHHYPHDRSYQYDYAPYQPPSYLAPPGSSALASSDEWPQDPYGRDFPLSPESVPNHSPPSWARYPDRMAPPTAFPLPPPLPVPVARPPMTGSSRRTSSDRVRLPALQAAGPPTLTRGIPPPPALTRMEWGLGGGSDPSPASARSPASLQPSAHAATSTASTSPIAVVPERRVVPMSAPAPPNRSTTATAKATTKRQRTAPSALDEDELDRDDDKERISKNYFQFSVATYKLMVKYLERAEQEPSGNSNANGPSAKRDTGGKRSNVLSDRYPTTQEIHDVDPANCLPRKRWKRLQENLQLWSNRPMFRNLSWKGCSLIIVPREHWRDVFLEHHIMRVPNPVTQTEIHRHMSARDTFHSLWKAYQTRRSRCGLTMPMIEAMVAECQCPMSGTVVDASVAGTAATADVALEDETHDMGRSSLAPVRLPSPPLSANPDTRRPCET